MTREEAYELVTSWTENKNLVKHMLAVEAQMRALALHFGEDEEKWGLAGLIHDADYEKWPDQHPLKTVEELKKRKAPDWLIEAVKAHAFGFREGLPSPKTKMEWALYTCDELAGFIIACALVRPDPPSHEASGGQVESSKLQQVTVEAVLKKWKEKSFAKGVSRKQVELCKEKLGLDLGDFTNICLRALQKISPDLGL